MCQTYFAPIFLSSFSLYNVFLRVGILNFDVNFGNLL